jgi:HEPN domain-containing protein
VDKKQHIDYWLNSAKDSWETAMFNYEGKQRLAALFFFHLTIEKVLKAIWVKDNVSNIPTFTHDLQKLLSETSLNAPAEHYDYLSVMNAWNIESRYPDYKNTLSKIATDEYLLSHYKKTKQLREWLLSTI